MTYANQYDIILIADPRVLAIPVYENHEPFANLRDMKSLTIGSSPEIPDNTNYTYVRQNVYQKLQHAQACLPPGVHFCLYEGYRSLELQKMLFDTRYKIIKARYPDWSIKDVFNETTKLVSPVINHDGTDNIPPHSTGAAIDVYLIDDNGLALDMGIHPKDWMRDKDGSLSRTASTSVSTIAKINREIMNAALEASGFVNYPTEYWHWSYGDRYWAYVTHQSFAIYGSYFPER